MTHTQFFADQVEQLDLALDQLALKDRNFDRFAILLIDNVVELTLHRHAQNRPTTKDENSKAVAAALTQYFDPKVKLAKVTGMLTEELADSISYLHSFRNTAHHSGLRHEGILHALALFYFRCACTALHAYKGGWWSSSSDDVIPHRAMKYLGRSSSFLGGHSQQGFQAAFNRLRDVADSMGDTLCEDLVCDMKKTVESMNEAIQFLADDSPRTMTRHEAIVEAQIWPFAFTDEAKAFARKTPSYANVQTVGGHIDWLRANYPWPTKKDPIPSWNKRLRSLATESVEHAALKKYCDFMNQTGALRTVISYSAEQLDGRIQQQIDEMRGK